MSKALLYKVDAEQLVEVEITDLDSIYAHLECDTIDSTRLNDDMELYVDDNGLLVDKPNYGMVMIDNRSKVVGVLAGNLLFVEHDDDGSTIDISERRIAAAKELSIETIMYDDGRVLRALIYRVE